MNVSIMEFPSMGSLSAWAKDGELEFIPVKNKRNRNVAAILRVKKDDLFHYFRAEDGHFSLLATSSKDIFAEKTDE